MKQSKDGSSQVVRCPQSRWVGDRPADLFVYFCTPLTSPNTFDGIRRRGAVALYAMELEDAKG